MCIALGLVAWALEVTSVLYLEGNYSYNDRSSLAHAGVRFLKAENINAGLVSSSPEFFISEEDHQLLR